jgi:aspartyl-tRNA synthetase
MEYDEAMNAYGSDRPDLRFGMKLHDITDLAHKTDFGVFKNAPMVKAIVVPGRREAHAQGDRCAGRVGKGFGAKGSRSPR